MNDFSCLGGLTACILIVIAYEAFLSDGYGEGVVIKVNNVCIFSVATECLVYALLCFASITFFIDNFLFSTIVRYV